MDGDDFCGRKLIQHGFAAGIKVNGELNILSFGDMMLCFLGVACVELDEVIVFDFADLVNALICVVDVTG